MIQLVCERGQSYSDIADLLGISEKQVRDKARSALTELGGADPDKDVGLTDYLLGQADPIGRADAVRFLQQDPPTRDLAEEISTRIQALAPAAELPTLPTPKGVRRKAASPSPTEAATERTPAADTAVGATASTGDPSVGRSPNQTRLIAGLAAGAVILLFVVLGVAGVFSSDDPASGSASADSTNPLDDPLRDTTPVSLKAVDGSGVAGDANFGLTQDTLFVDLSLSGLDPKLAEGEVYLMWLMLADEAGYPIPIPIQPDDNGNFNDTIPIAAPVALAVAGSAQTVVISRSEIGPLTKAVEAASTGQNPQLVVPFSGETLASGKIPLADDTSSGSNTAPDPGSGTTTTPDSGAGGDGG